MSGDRNLSKCTHGARRPSGPEAWLRMKQLIPPYKRLFRYREVLLKANSRYLDALGVVNDPTNAKRDLDRITTRKKDAADRGCSAFNPPAHHDVELFQAVMDGEHCLRGFLPIAISGSSFNRPIICDLTVKIRKRPAPR